MKRWWKRLETGRWEGGGGWGGGVLSCRGYFVFCLISCPSSPSPSLGCAERQSHLGLDGKHKMTAAVSQNWCITQPTEKQGGWGRRPEDQPGLGSNDNFKSKTPLQRCQRSQVGPAASRSVAALVWPLPRSHGQAGFHLEHVNRNVVEPDWTPLAPKSHLQTSRNAAGSGAWVNAALAFPLIWVLCDMIMMCLLRWLGQSHISIPFQPNVPSVLKPATPLTS